MLGSLGLFFKKIKYTIQNSKNSCQDISQLLSSPKHLIRLDAKETEGEVIKAEHDVASSKSAIFNSLKMKHRKGYAGITGLASQGAKQFVE